MNRHFLTLGVAGAIALMTACGPGSTSQSESNETDSLESPVTEVVSTSGEDVGFQAFLQRFPALTLPAAFPPEENNYLQDGLAVIEADEKGYLNEDFFFYGFDQPIYYYGALQIHPQMYSVVAYQAAPLPSFEYVLINYDRAGNVLSSKTLAHYEFGTGVIHRSEATIEGQSLSITAIEEGRTEDYRIDAVSRFKLSADGAILPTGLPRQMLATYHMAVAKNGDYLVNAVCMGPDDYASESFELHQKGDSVLYFPYPDGNGGLLKEMQLTEGSFKLVFSNLDDPQDRLGFDLLLTPVENKPGVYRLGYQSEESFVIAAPHLTNYRQRKFPCADEKYLIIPAGISAVSLGYSLSFLDNLAQQYQLTYKTESEQNIPLHRLYNSRNELAIEVTANASEQVASITLFTPLFKTEAGITVGSTLGELLYAHENVTARNGEEGVLVNIEWLKKVSFQLDHIAGAPDTKVNLNDLNKNLKISRIVIQ